MSADDIRQFQELVWQYGRDLYRDMPWRHDTRPYYVLVSEIMLQQTQVDRVIGKFNEFIEAFPDIESLAQAPLDAVLRLWSGLGYNRRAKFLHEAAKMVVGDFEGVFPSERGQLIRLPGVGVNTAGAIMAYSFNIPSLFVETNVRTVYFHHFFSGDDGVTDADIVVLLEQTVDREHPREWYWALMDYGTFLKRSGVGNTHKSRHYKKQAPLKGSVREVRGRILKRLAMGQISTGELHLLVGGDDRFDPALSGLVGDGLIEINSDTVQLAR